jgi:hypothetical protein
MFVVWSKISEILIQTKNMTNPSHRTDILIINFFGLRKIMKVGSNIKSFLVTDNHLKWKF